MGTIREGGLLSQQVLEPGQNPPQQPRVPHRARALGAQLRMEVASGSAPWQARTIPRPCGCLGGVSCLIGAGTARRSCPLSGSRCLCFDGVPGRSYSGSSPTWAEASITPSGTSVSRPPRPANC